MATGEAGEALRHSASATRATGEAAEVAREPPSRCQRQGVPPHLRDLHGEGDEGDGEAREAVRFRLLALHHHHPKLTFFFIFVSSSTSGH